MTAKVHGLERLQRRFQALAGMPQLPAALRAEAEQIAETARARLKEQKESLAESVRVADQSGPNHPVFSVGSDDEGACLVEHGTLRKRAEPWLFPALFARSRAVKERLRQLLAMTMKSAGRL